MARGRPALVSANAGIHDWPQLQGGLFTLEPEQDLTLAIRDLAERPEAIWQQKASICRAAAEELNRQTILQWAEILAKYANIGSHKET